MSEPVGDIRVSLGLPGHTKTKKVIYRIGGAGMWALVRLWCYCGTSKPDGDLSGISDEDIEMTIDWSGEPGKFVETMVSVGFMGGEPGQRFVHHWDEHQPWVSGSSERKNSATLAALIKHHGKEKGEAMFHAKLAKRMRPACDPQENDLRNDADRTENPPTRSQSAPKRAAPSPSPSPVPIPNPPPQEVGLNSVSPENASTLSSRFDRFWAVYPNRVGKGAALSKWNSIKPDEALLTVILGAIEAQKKGPKWLKDGGQYIPNPATWLNQQRWLDEVPQSPATPAAASPATTTDANGIKRDAYGERIPARVEDWH